MENDDLQVTHERLFDLSGYYHLKSENKKDHQIK